MMAEQSGARLQCWRIHWVWRTMAPSRNDVHRWRRRDPSYPFLRARISSSKRTFARIAKEKTAGNVGHSAVEEEPEKTQRTAAGDPERGESRLVGVIRTPASRSGMTFVLRISSYSSSEGRITSAAFAYASCTARLL